MLGLDELQSFWPGSVVEIPRTATGDLHSEVLRWCARLEPGGDYSRSLEKFEHRSLQDDANMPTKTRSLRNSQYSPP